MQKGRDTKGQSRPFALLIDYNVLYIMIYLSTIKGLKVYISMS